MEKKGDRHAGGGRDQSGETNTWEAEREIAGEDGHTRRDRRTGGTDITITNSDFFLQTDRIAPITI